MKVKVFNCPSVTFKGQLIQGECAQAILLVHSFLNKDVPPPPSFARETWSYLVNSLQPQVQPVLCSLNSGISGMHNTTLTGYLNILI